MRCHLTPVRMAIITKWKITSAGEVVEKKEHSFTADWNVNWYSHGGKQYGGDPKN